MELWDDNVVREEPKQPEQPDLPEYYEILPQVWVVVPPPEPPPPPGLTEQRVDEILKGTR